MANTSESHDHEHEHEPNCGCAHCSQQHDHQPNEDGVVVHDILPSDDTEVGTGTGDYLKYVSNTLLEYGVNLPRLIAMDKNTSYHFDNQFFLDEYDPEKHTIELHAEDGYLTFASSEGIEFLQGGADNDGVYDSTLQFTGSLDAINAALSDITYTPFEDFSGPRSSINPNPSYKLPVNSDGTVTVTWSLVPEGSSNYFGGGFPDEGIGPYSLETIYDMARWAFDQWADVAPIRFVEVPDDPEASTIRIGYSPLPGSTIGKAVYPSDSINGSDATIDSTVQWNFYHAKYMFQSILIHEIGHTLGLSHIDDVNAIMRPVAQIKNILHETDIEIIQEKYGNVDTSINLVIKDKTTGEVIDIEQTNIMINSPNDGYIDPDTGEKTSGPKVLVDLNGEDSGTDYSGTWTVTEENQRSGIQIVSDDVTLSQQSNNYLTKVIIETVNFGLSQLEYLSYTESNGLIVKQQANQLIIQKSNFLSAPVSDFEQLLKSIRYHHDGEPDQNSQKQFTITATGLNAITETASSTSTITIQSELPEPEFRIHFPEQDPFLFRENSDDMLIAEGVTVSTNQAFINGMSITLNDLADQAQEFLTVNTGSTNIEANYNSETGVLQLTGEDSAQAYQAVLRTLSYCHTSEDPTQAARSITITDSQSNLYLGPMVYVDAIDDPLTVKVYDTTVTTDSEDQFIAANAVISDPDTATMEGLIVIIKTLDDGETEEFSYTLTDSNIRVTTERYSDGYFSFGFTGDASHEAYQALLRSFKYNNTDGNFTEGERNVTVSVKADNQPWKTHSFSFNVLASQPEVDVLISISNTTNVIYAEDQLGSLLIAKDILLHDPDDTTLSNLQVILLAQQPDDEMITIDTGDTGITASVSIQPFSTNLGFITINLQGVANIADYEAALQSLRYENSADHRLAGERTIYIRTTSEDGEVSQQSFTIDVEAYEYRKVGSTSNDSLVADNDNNFEIYGYKGDDVLTGKSGNDVLDGGDGNDRLFGHAGNDHILGGNGDDYIEAGIGNDMVYGGTGNDQIIGGSKAYTGNNTFYGEEGNDELIGGKVNDVLSGGEGDDVLSGYLGKDILTGGQGNDLFKFAFNLSSTSGAANRDVITDFEVGIDKIDLSAAAWFTRNELGVRYENGNTIVYNKNDDFEIELTGIHSITEDDVNFVSWY